MQVFEKGGSSLSQALLEEGFRCIDEFDVFVTFARDNDLFKIHVGPDGSFAAFDDADELITEGAGMEDLYRVLVGKPAVLLQQSPPELLENVDAVVGEDRAGLLAELPDFVRI
jgi:hypothetical protein